MSTPINAALATLETLDARGQLTAKDRAGITAILRRDKLAPDTTVSEASGALSTLAKSDFLVESDRQRLEGLIGATGLGEESMA